MGEELKVIFEKYDKVVTAGKGRGKMEITVEDYLELFNMAHEGVIVMRELNELYDRGMVGK